jgi:hypothetical protein
MKPDEQRAYDHYRWADRYNRNKEPKKAAAHLRRAVQLQRGARFGALEEKPVLLSRIYIGGYSNSARSAVYDATFADRPAVCKVMHDNELVRLMEAAAHGVPVARILYSSTDFSVPTAQGVEGLLSTYGPFRGMVPSNHSIVAMEKLTYVQLHPDPGGLGTIINTDEALQARLNATPRQMYPVRVPDQPRLLRELLDAIVNLNQKGRMWRRVDQRNTGVGTEGHLRIFDFGSAQPVSEVNRHEDILAYGKLLYNALIRFYALDPGSHYLSRNAKLGRDLSKAQLVSTVDLLSGASEHMDKALRACFSLDDYSEPASIARVVDHLHAALRELGA